jgi:CHASE3 domain sensor protein
VFRGFVITGNSPFIGNQLRKNQSMNPSLARLAETPKMHATAKNVSEIRPSELNALINRRLA